jgi:excisionase family DNA binding protein
MLPIGRSTIYKLVATGELRSVKVGKKILIPDSAIHEFVERDQHNGLAARTVA